MFKNMYTCMSVWTEIQSSNNHDFKEENDILVVYFICDFIIL